MTYKKFDGKKIENFYLNDGEILNSQEAISIVEKTHVMWKNREDRMGI